MRFAIYLVLGLFGVLIVQSLLEPSYTIQNNPPTGDVIVSFGDSLTYGTGASKGMDYPAQLSRLIGVEIINKGRPGDTTASALKRIDDIIALKPSIVLITLGGNDLKNGVKRDIAFTNLKQIIISLQQQGALIILGGIDVPLFSRGFADAYAETAEATGSVLIPNVLEDIMGNRNLMSDRIHPNDDGYVIMTQYFYDAIKPYI